MMIGFSFFLRLPFSFSSFTSSSFPSSSEFPSSLLLFSESFLLSISLLPFSCCCNSYDFYCCTLLPLVWLRVYLLIALEGSCISVFFFNGDFVGSFYVFLYNRRGSKSSSGCLLLIGRPKFFSSPSERYNV